MEIFLILLLALAMLATLGVLFMGMIGMARGDSPARANKLMQNRIMLQGAAIAIFTLLLLLLRR
jgi:hypoxia induced protein